MNLLDPEVFFLRHLPLHFREHMTECFNNTSLDSWLDVHHPINLYKRLVEFLQFLRSDMLGLRPTVLAALLDKYFVVPIDIIHAGKPCPKEINDVSEFLFDKVP